MKERLLKFIDSKECIELFNDFYGKDKNRHDKEKKRYLTLLDDFSKDFNNKNYYFFSTPGRTEIIGNHTDHNLGKVVAAGITLDSLSVAEPTDKNVITIKSKYYNKSFSIDLNDLEPVKGEDSTEALIRGIAAGFKKKGFVIGGFNALMDSDVLPGSGLSSSAAFEVLIGTILNSFYNNEKISLEEIAKIGQFAENNYMGKLSGLMDQMACALGGIITIDFKDKDKPVVKKIEYDFSGNNYSIIVVNTGGNHENLSPYYSSIPMEMKKIANFFNKDVLREVNFDNINNNIADLHKKIGDRPILRAFHYFSENQRVEEVIKAFKQNNFNLFLDLINSSGNSSWKYLQNCYVPSNPNEQSVNLGLAITEQFIKKINEGACRIHGGGFAGTILVFLPDKYVNKYIEIVEKVFGKSSVKLLGIRDRKSMKIF